MCSLGKSSKGLREAGHRSKKSGERMYSQGRSSPWPDAPDTETHSLWQCLHHWGLCVPSSVSCWPTPGKGEYNLLPGNFWQVCSCLPRSMDLWGCRCQPLAHIILSSWEMGIPALQMERETQVKRLSSLPWSLSYRKRIIQARDKLI